jgi:toxin ParE1/3/4
VKHKPIIRRSRADRDIQEAVDHYLRDANESIALAFIDAVEKSFQHVGLRPATGSTRYGHELDVPGLRCWPVKGYPYLVFYIEREDHIDVWRVLHGQRDIPVWLRDEG